MRKLRNIIYQIVRRLRLLLGTGLKHLLVLPQRELPLNLQLRILQKLVQPHFYLYCFIRFGSDVVDLVSMYGLSQETVDRYVSLGFDRDLVIEKMRKLNIRSLTLEETEGEKGVRLIDELLSST